jgi:uncharacterized protein
VFAVDRDPLTGEPVEGIEPDTFMVDDRQHLDLSEAVRQYEMAALPIQPVCREDCAGLCPTCGKDLNQGPCGCSRETDDSRWGTLAGLAEQLRQEEADGGSKA